MVDTFSHLILILKTPYRLMCPFENIPEIAFCFGFFHEKVWKSGYVVGYLSFYSRKKDTSNSRIRRDETDRRIVRNSCLQIA